MHPSIFVYNESKLVTDDEMRRACAAIQRQLVEHFEPHWKYSAILHAAKADEDEGDAWPFKLVDSIDAENCFGYHTADKKPSALIDVALCLQEKITWSSCLSHEVLEAVADPECVRCFDIGGKVESLEVSDAVEGSKRRDGSDYEIDGVVLENFVLPAWFILGSDGPWDYLELLSGPLTRLDGGYDSTAVIGPWKQHSGEKTRASKLLVGHNARRAVRRARTNGLDL